MSDPWDSANSKLARIMRRRRRVAGLRWVAVAALVAAAAAYFWLTPVETPEPTPEPVREASPKIEFPRPPVEAAGGTETVAAVVEPFELPALDESDPTLRDWASRLSSRLELESWLATEDLVRRFVTIVDNVAEGEQPKQQLRFLAPDQSFRADEQADRLVTDPASHRRYDLAVDVFTSLDANAAAVVYRRFEPLADEAYRELGHPDGDFDDTLARAFAELLATPVVRGSADLNPRVTTYEFADPELELLSPVQKQLRALAAALGIPNDSLPPPRTYTPESP